MSGYFDDDLFYKYWEKATGKRATDNLLFYSSLLEKKAIFGAVETFDSSSRFFNFIEYELPKMLLGKKVIFCGLGEARYRLYSKAQHAWQKNEIMQKALILQGRH